jgi:hypothetical protein
MQSDVSAYDSDKSKEAASVREKLPAWLKVGTVAAASALAGGLAAAWYYRKAVLRLREAEIRPENSNFRIPESERRDDE